MASLAGPSSACAITCKAMGLDLSSVAERVM